jgi:hypothetical protein
VHAAALQQLRRAWRSTDEALQLTFCEPLDAGRIGRAGQGFSMMLGFAKSQLLLPLLLQARRAVGSAVFHAVQHLRNPMDLLLWSGANHGDAQWHREDLQGHQGSKNAVSCADWRGALH